MNGQFGKTTRTSVEATAQVLLKQNAKKARKRARNSCETNTAIEFMIISGCSVVFMTIAVIFNCYFSFKTDSRHSSRRHHHCNHDAHKKCSLFGRQWVKKSIKVADRDRMPKKQGVKFERTPARKASCLSKFERERERETNVLWEKQHSLETTSSSSEGVTTKSWSCKSLSLCSCRLNTRKSTDQMRRYSWSTSLLYSKSLSRRQTRLWQQASLLLPHQFFLHQSCSRTFF